MKISIPISTSYLESLRFSGSERIDLIYSRMRFFSQFMTVEAAKKLINRIDTIPSNSNAHPDIDLLQSIVGDGLEEISFKRFPSAMSMANASKLGLSFVLMETKGLLCLDREADEMIEAGIASQMPDLEKIVKSSPEVIEFFNADNNVERIVKANIIDLPEFSWTTIDQAMGISSIKTGFFDMGLELIGPGKAMELSWPIKILHRNIPLKELLSGRARMWVESEGMIEVMDSNGFDEKRSIISEAYAAVPVPLPDGSSGRVFDQFGYLRCRSDSDFTVVMNNNEEISHVTPIVADGMISTVLGPETPEGFEELLSFGTPTAEEIVRTKMAGAGNRKMVIFAMPSFFEFEGDTISELSVERGRPATAFMINMIGVTSSTTTEEFYEAIRLIIRRSKQSNLM